MVAVIEPIHSTPLKALKLELNLYVNDLNNFPFENIQENKMSTKLPRCFAVS